MTARYNCPIPACGWFHDAMVATPPPPERDTEPGSLAALAYVPTVVSPAVGVADHHVVHAHLATHFVSEWMLAWFEAMRRAAAAEQRLARILAALESAAIAALDGVSPGGRMPSRAEVYGGCDG